MKICEEGDVIADIFDFTFIIYCTGLNMFVRGSFSEENEGNSRYKLHHYGKCTDKSDSEFRLNNDKQIFRTCRLYDLGHDF